MEEDALVDHLCVVGRFAGVVAVFGVRSDREWSREGGRKWCKEGAGRGARSGAELRAEKRAGRGAGRGTGRVQGGGQGGGQGRRVLVEGAKCLWEIKTF